MCSLTHRPRLPYLYPHCVRVPPADAQPADYAEGVQCTISQSKSRATTIITGTETGKEFYRGGVGELDEYEVMSFAPCATSKF